MSSSVVKFLAATRMSWTRHVSGGATARFPSHPQRIPTHFISTVQQTPVCLWLTVRPTSLLLKSLSQSAVQMKDRGLTRAARRRGGSRCSSHSSHITWRITGQLKLQYIFNNGVQNILQSGSALKRVTVLWKYKERESGSYFSSNSLIIIISRNN